MIVIGLFVAVGLALLAGVAIARARGREVPPLALAAMAALAGATLAFLVLLASVPPFVLFPATLTAVLCAAWVRQGTWRVLGSFLVGGAVFWLAFEAWSAWNDLSDGAVSRVSWGPLPAAIAVGVLIAGGAARVASSRAGRRTPEA